MTVREFYETIDGSYEKAIERLMNENLILRFSKKFLEDTNYFELLSAMDGGDTEAAFRAAHTLKGLAMNLQYDRLAETASAITEKLRAKDLEQAVSFIPRLEEEYRQTTDAILELLK